MKLSEFYDFDVIPLTESSEVWDIYLKAAEKSGTVPGSVIVHRGTDPGTFQPYVIFGVVGPDGLSLSLQNPLYKVTLTLMFEVGKEALKAITR